METIANAVVNFSSDDGDGERNYKLTVTPADPEVNQSVKVEIISGDEWIVTSDAAQVSQRNIFSVQNVSEDINMLGERKLSTSLPVKKVLSARAKTALTDSETQDVIYPAYSNVLPYTNAVLGYALFDFANVFGTISLTYSVFNKQSWTISGLLRAGVYLVFATNKETGKVEKIIIDVKEDESEEDGPFLVTINTRDFCSDQIIIGASIYIDGVLKGVSDASGNLSIGELLPGSHTLRITASGYLDSDVDDLANEVFSL